MRKKERKQKTLLKALLKAGRDYARHSVTNLLLHDSLDGEMTFRWLLRKLKDDFPDYDPKEFLKDHFLHVKENGKIYYTDDMPNGLIDDDAKDILRAVRDYLEDFSMEDGSNGIFDCLNNFMVYCYWLEHYISTEDIPTVSQEYIDSLQLAEQIVVNS